MQTSSGNGGGKNQSEPFSQPYSFTGREWDSETGLYFYRARYYDPEAGRFISRDPIGFTGGDMNLYGYVGNNPLNAIDPMGLASYTGILNLTSAGFIGGGAVIWGSVETECIDGIKQQGILLAGFIGADVGLPVSSTAFTAKFSDNSPGRGDLRNLEGFSRIFSLSGALGGGISISNIILGDAETSGNAGAVDASGQLGFDMGVLGMSGWSNVLSITETECGCEQ